MEQPNLGNIDVERLKPSGNQLRSIVSIIAALFIAFIVWNLWFTVEPEELGIVLRFGKFVREAPPGLNFKLPDPVEKVIKVPVQRQLKEEFGFRTELASIQTRYSPRNFQNESLMLTGDLNVAVVEWSTQYRIRDPYRFLFKVKNPRTTFRDMNEAAMRKVVGDKAVDKVLTIGRQEIADQVKMILQEMCDQYETGIVVDQVVLQDVNPPDPVKPSFNEVNQAQQEREKMINQARSDYNRVIPRAKGQAMQTIQQAEGYATDRINRARGDAEFFDALYQAYRKAPEVTRRRMYLETMDSVYPGIKQKIIIDKDMKSILPLLSLEGGNIK
ncbi:MAG TPA: FtsH protease activity modulator HflK [Thermodesulfobacteriaceae bacterium]|nr:FtsH protease activity modulator HflK [Thermodesulfobacteriaceae bacterium]